MMHMIIDIYGIEQYFYLELYREVRKAIMENKEHKPCAVDKSQ